MASLKNERISAADGGRPYSIFEGTLDDCVRQFMAKPGQRHMYEIQTSQQGELISAVLSAEQIVELDRLRDFSVGGCARVWSRSEKNFPQRLDSHWNFYFEPALSFNQNCWRNP